MTRQKAVIFFLAFLLACFVSIALAQDSPISKKSINIGGTFSLQSYSGELYGNETSSLAILTTSFRYFIIPGLAVGGDLTYMRSASGNDSSSTIGIGPAVAYFFDVKSGKFYPYVGAGLFYSSQSASSGNYSISSTGLDFRFGGGIAFMLKKNLAIVAEMNYHIQSLTPEHGSAESGNILSFAVGLAAFIY